MMRESGDPLGGFSMVTFRLGTFSGDFGGASSLSPSTGVVVVLGGSDGVGVGVASQMGGVRELGSGQGVGVWDQM